MTGYRFEFQLGSETRTIETDESIAPNLPITLSQADEWDVEVPYRDDLSGFELADAEVYYVDRGGQEHLIYRGYVDITEGDPDSTMTVRGQDDTAKLKRGGTQETYETIEGFEAIKDYTDEHLDDWEWDVLEPETDIIDEELPLQDAPSIDDFTELFDTEAQYADDEDLSEENLPVEVTEDGIEVLQTCVIVDLSGGESDERYSGGSANDGFIAESISFNHTILSEHIGLAFRHGELGGDVDQYEINLGDISVTEFYAPSSSDGPYWQDMSSSAAADGSDFESGSLTVGLNEENEDPLITDCAVVWDQRYHDIEDFSEEVHEPNGYLDRPWNYPESPESIITGETDSTFNVTRGYVDIDSNDSNGVAGLGVSFEGDDFETESGTNSADFGTDVATTTLVGQLMLGGRTDLDPQEATPRFGYEGQKITNWELRVDTNDLRVIEDMEVVGSHYDNLKDLHEEAGMAFLPVDIDFGDENPQPSWSEDGLRGASFTPGQLELEADWRRLDKTKTRNLRDYANILKGFGEEDEDTGERIEVEVSLPGEIDEHGEVPGEPVISDATTLSELTAEARNELFDMAGVDRTTGSVEIAPKVVWPGFAYYVPVFDETLTLEELSFQDGSSPQAELSFEQGVTIESLFGSVRTDIRRARR